MSGSGAALRLHEFRDRLDSKELQQLAKRAVRQGSDVRGLYPGQLGRVHTTHSPSHRVRFASLEYPTETNAEGEKDQYQRSFDLQACQALAVAHGNGMTPSTNLTSYQDHFGTWSGLYAPAETKYTLRSHPEPLQATERRATTTTPHSRMIFH